MADVQLHAAANVLLVEDGSRHGRDRVAGLAALAAVGLAATSRSSTPNMWPNVSGSGSTNRMPATGPASARCSSGPRSRRGSSRAISLNCGPRPRTSACAMSIEPVHRLALLQGIWTMRPTRRWESIAPAESVYDLCRIAPVVSGRILADYPDLFCCFTAPTRIPRPQLWPSVDLRSWHRYWRPHAGRSGCRCAGGERGSLGQRNYCSGRTACRSNIRRPATCPASCEWLRFRTWARLPLLDNYMSPGCPRPRRSSTGILAYRGVAGSPPVTLG